MPQLVFSCFTRRG